MKSYSVNSDPRILRMGRHDKNDAAFELYYSGSMAVMNVKGSRLEAEIECGYDALRPYITFEVDGLRAQTLSPLEGTNFYTVFMGMDSNKTHKVRIIKESQAFTDNSFVKLKTVRTDGKLVKVAPKKRRIEFIGDSVTAGEGVRGPKNFSEWMPMMFCSTDDYALVTADKLKAEFQTVAVSGWGVVCSWDNDPKCNLPRIYDKLYGLRNDTPYEFDFKPDTVVIALGTNDNSAASQNARLDEASGKMYKLTDSREDTELFRDKAYEFIKRVNKLNPGAKIVWLTYFKEGRIHAALNEAVLRAHTEGIDVCLCAPIDIFKLPRGGMGSRSHPGKVTHKAIAEALYKLLK